MMLPSLTPQKGATLLEMALIAALIAAICIPALTYLGEESSEAINNVGDTIEDVNDQVGGGQGASIV